MRALKAARAHSCAASWRTAYTCGPFRISTSRTTRSMERAQELTDIMRRNAEERGEQL